MDLIHRYAEWRRSSQSLGSLLGSLGVALHTQDPALQGVASVFIRLDGQRASAVLRKPHGSTVMPGPEPSWTGTFLWMSVRLSHLTTVTLEVEVFVEGHDPDRLLAARRWNDGFITAHTQRGETPGTNRDVSEVGFNSGRIYTNVAQLFL